MYTALTASSQTLAAFVSDQLVVDPNLGALFGAAGTMVVSLNNPEEMTADNRQGVSLWLYRVNRDGDTLNRPMVQVNSTLRRYPPLPLQLHYLVTPIVNRGSTGSAETEQMILGKVLQILHDRCRLRGTDLRGDFSGTEVELAVRLGPQSLEEITRVWNALDRSYQLSVSYEVTLVDIDSALVETSAMVREVIPQTAVVVD